MLYITSQGRKIGRCADENYPIRLGDCAFTPYAAERIATSLGWVPQGKALGVSAEEAEWVRIERELDRAVMDGILTSYSHWHGHEGHQYVLAQEVGLGHYSGPEDSRLAAAKRALEWVQQKRAEAEAKKHPEPEPDPNSHLSLDQCMTRIRQGFPEAKTGYWGLCTCIYPGPPYSSAALCTSASHLWSARRALAHLEKHYPKAFAAADAPEKPKLPVIGTMTMDETAAELRRRGWHTELRGDKRAIGKLTQALDDVVGHTTGRDGDEQGVLPFAAA